MGIDQINRNKVARRSTNSSDRTICLCGAYVIPAVRSHRAVVSLDWCLNIEGVSYEYNFPPSFFK